MQTSIIGAGPSGLYSAYHLSKAGIKTKVYDKKTKIGLPIQCTGLLTKDVFKHIPKKDINEFLVNKTKKIRLISQNNEATIPATEYIINRQKFDSYLKQLAESEGVKIILKSKLENIHQKNCKVKFQINKKSKEATHLIGADGPLSTVSKFTFPNYKPKTILGNQVIAKGNYNPATFTTHFGTNFKNFFGWIVPESNNIARIGYSGIHTKQQINNLLNLTKSKQLSTQAGLIPIFQYNRPIQKNNTILIGDAAGFVKNTTGGGIISGLESARFAANSVIKNKDYQNQTIKLRLSLQTHKIIRTTLNNFTDKDYNQLINEIKKKNVQKILYSTSRDNPVKLLTKLTLANPQFLKFTPKLFQKLLNSN